MSTACHGHGAEIRSTKSCDAAEWLAMQNNFAVQKSFLISSFYPCAPYSSTNPISPLPNVTPDFQKRRKKRNTFSKRVIFSTDCRQSMGLQSVLKIRVKTAKLFALRASSYKGSRPRADLDLLIFSRYSSTPEPQTPRIAPWLHGLLS